MLGGGVFPMELQFESVGMKILEVDRNALDLLYLKTSLWSSHLWGAIPKQPAFTRQTLQDVSNKCESAFFIS